MNEFQAKFLFQPTNYPLQISQQQQSKIKNDTATHDEYLVLNCVKLKENLTGLVNLGNTCYLNCILQVLYSCKKYVFFFFLNQSF